MKQPSHDTVATHPPRLYLLPSLVPPRRALSPRSGYAVAALVVGLGLFASVTPSPLYRSYSVLWHFSPLTLTLIYATYAFGVLASLLLAGGVSDDVGRRPVLLAALGALSAASAALLDLHPKRDPAGVGLTTATAAAGGIGLGVLVSSVLVQLGTLPRVLPYVLLFVLFAVAFAGAYWMPEPVEKRGRFRLTAERPRVPAVVRRPFFLAALAVISSWSIGGLFFSLGPQLAAHLFNSTNVIVSGSGIVALAGAAVVAQLLTARTAPWIGAGVGSIALAAGMVLIVFAAARDSSAAYLAGSILAGAGFGAAFLGGLRALAAAIPHEQRAAVMSAFYVAAYTSLSLPAVLAGIVVAHVALPTTFELFGGVVAAIALIVAFEAWRTRPTPRRAA